MLERRPLYGVLIALLLCVSLWQIALQESQFVPEYAPLYVLAQPATSSPDNPNNGSSYPPAISLDQLSTQDLHQLIDLENFDYLIRQPACPTFTAPNYTIRPAGPLRPAQHTLIIVHSAPKNWNKRNVIRETWGREDPNTRLLFLLGAVESKKLQHKLEKENYLFDDLLQGNFLDTYRNMTYKHVMGLKWFMYNCPEVKYLLKTDDDVFINTPNLYEFLQDPSTDPRDLLMCYRIEYGRISRSYRSKWRVRTKEYAGHYYPPYCPGYSIVYSADTAFTLYREAQRTPYFWIDDVHVTGTLATAANVTIQRMGNRFLKKDEMYDFLKGFSVPSYENFMFTVPNLTEETIRALWRQVEVIARNRSHSSQLPNSGSSMPRSQPSELSASPTLMNR